MWTYGQIERDYAARSEGIQLSRNYRTSFRPQIEFFVVNAQVWRYVSGACTDAAAADDGSLGLRASTLCQPLLHGVEP